ncbi:outer membrane lipoprotein carrier protein LolA [Oceanispirochaeta crateris]|jgi:outer membrane lipoprotein-sorting protein|uniref:Outer membrane lipoprotein carrier protein LolA n=1 Tax=Oceanispirochaeta crateris TaxID=2518645 RepID=A0A5C1QMA5_9SPIO|nr:outer-membrane lipoprotein carrier protein LolA [Oceanispirochaeta crateris]QEN08458.1 outer membrane lipoprotein carrier protein LolA [Oceanispirochaeta crateris]
MNRLLAALFLLLAGIFSVSAQETAEKYFDRISNYYGSIRDYEGDLVITRGDVEQVARISYKNPNMMRLDFSDPAGQVLNVNNESLELYLPEYRVSFVQPLKSHSQSTLAGMANSQGLELMKKNYSIGYVSGPQAVPLEEGSEEMVIKLKLNWRSTSEGFRELHIAVGQDNLIRRIEGVTTTLDRITFDFTNLETNKGIPDARFDYKSPPEGNSIENFLFEPEN